jgi:enamine deaminase RidA (YjgF/YER057c/UK114 family)
MRRLISSGSPFESEIGYSRAVIHDGEIFISGTTGFDYATMQIAGEIEAQAEQCFRNIGAVLQQAGATFADIVRIRYIVPAGPAEFQKCWPVFQKYLADIRPAATFIAAGLSDSRMKIEIEVDARIGA